LLAKVTFEKNTQRDGHGLSEIAKACLTAPDDSGIAKQLCERLRDGVNQWKVWASHYGALVTELAALFPRAVLDVVVERNAMEDHLRPGIFENFSERRSCPLRMIDDAFLLDWAHEKPGSRFVQLAEAITPWTEADRSRAVSDREARAVEWTPVAKRLMHEAPEAVVVLQKFRGWFHPSGWSGSLADILESRMPLLEQLTSDSDQRIAKWAREAIPSLRREIKAEREREATRHRTQDERFEW